MAELWQLDAHDLLQGFRARAFTPSQALRACLDRAGQWQPYTHAFVSMDAEGAMRAAHASDARWQRNAPIGPLDGIPLSLKDNLHAQGLRTTWGSKLLQAFTPAQDELPVARARAQGAVIFGKTSLPEFAMLGATFNDVNGVTRNPWNLALTPGGSSGGAAAAVAAGCGPLALTTDGAGSTRRPASHCGLIGFKPSSHSVPRAGGLPAIFLHYETVGVMARSVRDVRMLFGALSDRALPDCGLPEKPCGGRILYVPAFAGHPVDAGIGACVARAAMQLRLLGHAVDEAPSFDLAEPIHEAWGVLSAAGLAWMAERAAGFAEFQGEAFDVSQCTQAMQSVLATGRKLGATALLDLFTRVDTLQRELDVLFARYDYLLTPCTAALPWPAHEPFPRVIAQQEAGPRGHAVFTAFANAAGLPAIAMPCGTVDGLPTGFQLVAAHGKDAQLLALASHYERAHPAATGWPALPDN